MAEDWVRRAGVVVVAAGRPMVRFADAGCGACSAGCAVSGQRAGTSTLLPLASLGLRDHPQPGARVSVSLRAGFLNRLALACFAMPLLALLAGAWAGARLGGALGVEADTASGGLGLLALALALWLVSRGGARLTALLKFNARVERMIT